MVRIPDGKAFTRLLCKIQAKLQIFTRIHFVGKCRYSEVFWEKFPPTLFLHDEYQNTPTYLLALIKTFAFCDFWENLPHTRAY